MANKWTPGPWEVNGQGNFIDIGKAGFLLAQSHPSCHLRSAGGVVASIMPFDNPSRRNVRAMACAHLIAAAPDLYEALAAMLEAVKSEPAMNHHKYDRIGIQVNNALAKARGER